MTTDIQILDNFEIDAAPKLSLFNEFFELRLDFNSHKQYDIDVKIIVYYELIQANLDINNSINEVVVYHSKGIYILKNLEKVFKGKNLILARVKKFNCEDYEKNFNQKKRKTDFSVITVVIEKANEKLMEKNILLRIIKENTFLFKNLLC